MTRLATQPSNVKSDPREVVTETTTEVTTEVIEAEEVEVCKITTLGKITTGGETKKHSGSFCAVSRPKDRKLPKMTNQEATYKLEEVIIKKEVATSSLKTTIEETREGITITTSKTSL